MLKAKIGPRLLALLIDLIIVFVLTTFVAVIGNMTFDLTEPEDIELKVTETERELIIDKIDNDAKLNNLSREHIENNLSTYVIRYEKEEWIDYLDDVEQSANLQKIFINYYDGCIVYNEQYNEYINDFGLLSWISFLIAFILYFDVLGYYYKNQTFGRKVCKIKVVKTDGSKPSFYTLLVRDVVGFLLFNILNICMFVPLIVNTLNIMGKDQTTLADNMTKTMVVKIV